jgi:predicted RND superfamily exporter protein
MSRLENERYPFYSSKEEYFKDWLINKKKCTILGIQVRNRMIDLLREMEEKVENMENDILSLKKIKKKLENVNGFDIEYKIENLLQQAKTGIPKDLKYKLDTIIRLSNEINKEVETNENNK